MASCTTNEPCRQGYCCEDNPRWSDQHTCTWIPDDCYTGDGTKDQYEYCTRNSQCATQCCHSTWDFCWGTTRTSQCMSDGLPGWAVALIVVAVLAVVALLITCICCCVCQAQRKNKSPHSSQSSVTMMRNTQSGAPVASTISPFDTTQLKAQAQSTFPQGGPAQYASYGQEYYPQQGYTPQQQQYLQAGGFQQTPDVYQAQAPPQVIVSGSAVQQVPLAPSTVPVAEPSEDKPQSKPLEPVADPGKV